MLPDIGAIEWGDGAYSSVVMLGNPKESYIGTPKST